MQNQPQTAADVIGLWPSQAALAADLALPDDAQVRMWKYRQRIPAEYDFRLVCAAEARGLPITFELLARIRATASADA